MQIRRHVPVEKIEPQMAPMIDVVFQLLIFFMLTLKIVEPEGEFSINMPIKAPAETATDEPPIYDIKVHLHAGAEGELARLMLGERNLGNGEAAFRRLNSEILKLIGGRPGSPLRDETVVTIDPDYNLDIQYTISAISACTGRMNEDGKIVRYVENINLVPPRKPE